MTEPEEPLVKIVCGGCGKRLATVVDTGGGTFFRWRHGLTTDANALFCADHGWPDLADLRAKLADARGAGRVRTLRARMLRWVPDRVSYSDDAWARLTR